VKLTFGIFIGFVFGVIVTLASNHLVEVSYVPGDYEYQELLKLSSTQISDDKFLCEGFDEKTVGAVLGTIYKANSNSYLNRINESCSNKECQITYSTCKPWQNDSCGSTSLIFIVSGGSKIDEQSFRCLQVP